MNLFPFSDTTPIKLALKNELGDAISLTKFIGMPPEDFASMEWSDDKGMHFMSRKDTRLIKKIHSWIRYEFHNKPDIDMTSLTLDDYDVFLLDSPPDTPAGNVGLNQQSTNFIGTPGPNNPAKTLNFPPFGTPSMSGTASFMPIVKLDVKQYPTFNGDNASWTKFKRGVLSIASTHGLDDVFDTKITVPVVGDLTYQPFMEKVKFVYSIWMSRITGGLAMSIL